MSKDVIQNIERQVNYSISLLDIGYEIKDLVDGFNKVYYSFDTSRKRFKVIGNKHIKVFDNEKNKYIVKQKKVQIFLLKKNRLDDMNIFDLKSLYKEVIKFCFYIELLKMYKTIENSNSILEEKYSTIRDEELQIFIEDN